MYFMYNKLKFMHRKTQSVFFFKFLMIRLLSRHHPAAIPPRPSLFVRQPDKEGGAGRGWRKLSCRIFFKMASLRLPLDRPRPRVAMASTLPDSTSQLTSHLRQVSWGMIEQNCFERKQILSDWKRSRKVNFVDRHLEYHSLWYG